jgi:hypothetical protein
MSKFIIKSEYTSADFFIHFHELYESARTKALEDYLTGIEVLRTTAEVESLNQSQLSFFKKALVTQSQLAEEKMITAILDLLEKNPLYAYMYALPIVAVNPLYPTQQEIDASRVIIPYHKKTYIEYLRSINEDIEDVTTPERDEQYNSVRPSVQFIGFGSNDQANDQAAIGTVQIRSQSWNELATREARRSPSIPRLEPNDDFATISAKLLPDNLSQAINDYSRSSKHYQAERQRVADINASLLKFFIESVEGIEGTAAFEFIESQQWHKVVDAVRVSYGNINSPAVIDQMKADLATVTFGAAETVHQFINRIKRLVANIQVMSEVSEEKPNPLSFSKALLSSTYTEDQWKVNNPNNYQYTTHLTVLQRILTCLDQSRLHLVAYDFSTKVKVAADRTVERLIQDMVSGEAALNIKLQVGHQISTVTSSSNGNSDKTGSSKFCSFHSFGGNVSNHDNEHCRTQINGKTKPDPLDPKWLVYKSTGEHFKPKEGSSSSSGGASVGTKRANKNQNKGSNKESKTSEPIGKSCTKCLQLNREGESIPEKVMKNHTAETCRIKRRNSSDPKESNTKTNKKNDQDSMTKSQYTKLLTAVNSIKTNVKKTSKKSGKSSRHAKQDSDNDDDSDEES